MDKSLYIISGCNGAGKTTASYTVLPEVLDCKEFVHTSILYVEHKQMVILSDFFSSGSILQTWLYNVLRSAFRRAVTTYPNQ